jgi:hypothetical protein
MQVWLRKPRTGARAAAGQGPSANSFLSEFFSPALLLLQLVLLLWPTTAIRFLVFSSTERLRKKAKRRSKELREKRPNLGLFASTPKAEVFFGDARTSEWPVWPQNESFGTNQACTLCLW